MITTLLIVLIVVAVPFPFLLILLGFAGYMFIGTYIVLPLKTWLREREQVRLTDPATCACARPLAAP
jgi:hypothetical protein